METGSELEHEPVLSKEVLEYLSPAPGDVVIDCNLGHAGHAIEIAKQLRGGGLLVGIDIDPNSLRAARRRIDAARIDPALIRLVQANHSHLASLPELSHLPSPTGILLDLGPSTPQLLDPSRGMSWNSDEALDMRLDREGAAPNAADIVNEWEERDLTRLFRDKGDEKWAARIARRIVEERAKSPIRTGRRLGEIVGAAIPRAAWPPKIHPATRVFLALRIEVNREYENLEAVLPQALEILAPGGRLVVISFHGGEDVRVKRFFREMSRPSGGAPWPLPQKGTERPPRMKILTPEPIRATDEEIARNPRSRSARLRAGIKLEQPPTE